VGAFPVWRPNLDELDVDSAPASAFLILKSFKIIPLQLSCRVPARVLACLLSDGPGGTDGGILRMISSVIQDTRPFIGLSLTAQFYIFMKKKVQAIFIQIQCWSSFSPKH
jgi:hypothetical protein